MTDKEKYIKRLAADESEKSARDEDYHDRAVRNVDMLPPLPPKHVPKGTPIPSRAVPLCKVDVFVDGDEFVAVIHHSLPPIGDNRKEVPAKELRNHDKEALLMEMKRYLEDCYDDC